MSRLVRSATAGVAFLLTCGLLSTGTPAFAAPKSHPKPAAHGHAAATHSRPAPHRPVDRLAGLRNGAGHALAAGAARVKRIAAAEAASALLAADDKAALSDATTADLAALSADATAVGTATSVKAILTATQSGMLTSQGAELQYGVMLAAAKGQAEADSLAMDASAVNDQAATLAAGGTDVSSVTTPLADLASQVDQAATGAADARTAALATPAAPTAAQLWTTRATARTGLVAAGSALATGADDLASATAALTALQSP